MSQEEGDERPITFSQAFEDISSSKNYVAPSPAIIVERNEEKKSNDTANANEGGKTSSTSAGVGEYQYSVTVQPSYNYFYTP